VITLKNPANLRDFASELFTLRCSAIKSRSAVALKKGYGGTSAKAQSRLRRDEHIILRKRLTQVLSVRCIFEIASIKGETAMSLKDKLEKLKENFKTKIPPDAQEIMHRATEDLKNSGIMDHTVKVGDKAPDFKLRNTENQDVSLSTLLAKGPVVLTFYRGKW